MQFPASLPAELEELRSLKDPTNLFYRLIQNPFVLAAFIDSAFEDDLWINRSNDFIKMLLAWVSEQYAQGRLEEGVSQKIAHAIHRSYSRLRSLIPRNINILSEDKRYPVNALLFGTASPILRDLMQEELRGTSKSTVSIQGIPENILTQFIEFGEEGTLEDLWKQNSDEIIKMLRYSSSWRLENLTQLSQESLRRYIEKDTVIPFLLMAHKEKWEVLKGDCIDFFNTLGYYITLHKGGEGDFIVEFQQFHSLALEVYCALAPYTTHLICKGNLSQNAEFVEVMNSSPKMRTLDVSESVEYSNYFDEIPPKILELSLARCPWLDNFNLGKIVRTCRNVKRIDLTSETLIDYEGWTELQYWMLNGLILKDCHLLKDEELSLILKSCNYLKELDLEGCKGLSDTALRSLGKRSYRFSSLNLARTKLSDEAFVEIVYGLYSLDDVDISHCGITPETIAKVRRDFPSLRIAT